MKREKGNEPHCFVGEVHVRTKRGSWSGGHCNNLGLSKGFRGCSWAQLPMVGNVTDARWMAVVPPPRKVLLIFQKCLLAVWTANVPHV